MKYLLLLALLAGGCEYPQDTRVRVVEEETARINQELKQIEASLPVIEERRLRIHKLQEEIAALKKARK